jgi:hypothetical protein
MGKSQFKFAADQVVDDCIKHGYRSCANSDYYWAYRSLFEHFNDKFDLDKFEQYILKRI